MDIARESAQGRGDNDIRPRRARRGESAPYYTPMGAHLKERFGDDISSWNGLFKTRCNINTAATGLAVEPQLLRRPAGGAGEARLGGSYYLTLPE